MLRRVILAILLCAPICFGLDTIIEPKERMTKNVVFLLDTSGSMDKGALSKAVTAVINIATQSTDELNVAVFSFWDRCDRWSGVPGTEPDGGPPEGWAAMPSQDSAKKLAKWLEEIPPGGGTKINAALVEGLRVKQPEKGGLTVVVVTDDKVDAGQKTVMKDLVETLQAEREKDGLGKAILIGYGIGKGDDVSALRIIVNVGPCGGFFQEAD